MVSDSLLDLLQQRFRHEFGSADGCHLVLAPGRVNLIGEHTDYNGLPVLPIALQRNVSVLFRPRQDQLVRVRDLNDRVFGPREFELRRRVRPFRAGDWGNYVKAGAQALTDLLDSGRLNGFDAIYSGSIPSDAGLSSSSAMVVASALAVVHSNAIEIEMLQLADLLAEGEQYVGTRGGGMDQAICLGGKARHALKIDFFPLRMEPVPVPTGWSFVVGHSLSTASKASDALEKYNQRPRECHHAVSVLATELASGDAPKRIADLLDSHSAAQILSAADRNLNRTLLRRIRHAISEGERVLLARQALEKADLELFGRLMVESHRSLRDDYEISTKSLDRLVDCFLEGGATGARMTGGGFGGCAVAVCRAESVPSLVEHLEEHFYQGRDQLDRFAPYLLEALPSDGARLLF